MGRMHSKGKGKSRSSLPYKRSPASWLKTTPHEARRRSLLAVLGCSCSSGTPEARSNRLMRLGMAVQVEQEITKFAKKGMRPSAIGVMLRDQSGIAQVWLCGIGLQPASRRRGNEKAELTVAFRANNGEFCQLHHLYLLLDGQAPLYTCL